MPQKQHFQRFQEPKKAQKTAQNEQKTPVNHLLSGYIRGFSVSANKKATAEAAAGDQHLTG